MVLFTSFFWARSLLIVLIETDVCIDQDRCLYTYCVQNINSYELVLETVYCHIVLISQRCNVMLTNFMSFRILVC